MTYTVNKGMVALTVWAYETGTFQRLTWDDSWARNLPIDKGIIILK
jgi:hypothetical protein